MQGGMLSPGFHLPSRRHETHLLGTDDVSGPSIEEIAQLADIVR